MSLLTTERDSEEQAPPGVTTLEDHPSGRRPAIVRYAFMPALLAAVLGGLYVYVSGQQLDHLERVRVNFGFISTSLLRHLELTLISTLFVLAISIPLGVLLTRPSLGRVTPPTIALFNIGQSVPSIGLLALLVLVMGLGFWPIVIALVAYSALPVLRNTMVGLQQVDSSVIESARGMGMSRTTVLARIELPLAVPVIMAGVRTALVINVGTVALATFFNGGGLGDIINTGIVNGRDLVIVVGAVLTAALALLIDYLGGLAENLLRPRGL